MKGREIIGIPRLQIILQEGNSKASPPFDLYSHLHARSEKSIEQKLLEFKLMRTKNINRLHVHMEVEEQLELTGLHPSLGIVKVRELLSTWVAHDLTHIAQIVRIMAESYRSNVRPWKEYLGILRK